MLHHKNFDFNLHSKQFLKTQNLVSLLKKKSLDVKIIDFFKILLLKLTPYLFD